jgi:HECT-domain (ubiquitin-transferase)
MLTKFEITNCLWTSIFKSPTIHIFLDKKSISLSASYGSLNIMYESDNDIMFQLKYDNIQIGKLVAKQSGESRVQLKAEYITAHFHFFVTDNPWAYLDKSICSAGCYKGSKYFVNEKTYETSLTANFRSKNNAFPSFVRIENGGEIWFADTLSKIVLHTYPSMKQDILNSRLKSFISEISISYIGKQSKVCVERDNILQSSSLCIMKSLRNLNLPYLEIIFKNEIGQDYGAIKREFFYLAFQEIVKSPFLEKRNGIYDVALGSCPSYFYGFDMHFDIVEDIININRSIENPAVFYTFLGILFGLVLLHKDTIGFSFSLAFYENLLGRNFTIKHIQDVQYQRGILYGMREDLEGYSKKQIAAQVEDKLFLCKKNAYDYVRVGFQSVIRSPMDKFTAFDFPFIFHHFEKLTAQRIQRHVFYDNCNKQTQEIAWLWHILEGKEQEYLYKFLQFFTGSGNLARFNDECVFYFELTSCKNQMIRASSCAKRLFISRYDSIEKMEYFLDYSILNTEGFHKI